MTKTPEQIHAEVGALIRKPHIHSESLRAFTVSDIAKIIEWAKAASQECYVCVHHNKERREAKGGVCDWKKDFHRYMIGTCGRAFRTKDGDFCPGCGKEIKIV